MERVAVFVDAGYFWVQVSHLLFGEKRPRNEVSINAPLMRESLLAEVQKNFPEHSLLRIYWYDGLGTNEAPTEQHKMISKLDDIKMRYGTRNSFGQQKGVDGLLMADLIALAQNKAISSAMIISGDADLVPGISAAQMLGVRIHRLEISGQEASSPILCEEVDRNSEWNRVAIENFSSRAINTVALGSEEKLDPQSTSKPSLDDIVVECISNMSNDDQEGIRKNFSIPSMIDKRILYTARVSLGRLLGDEEKKTLRKKIQDYIKS